MVTKNNPTHFFSKKNLTKFALFSIISANWSVNREKYHTGSVPKPRTDPGRRGFLGETPYQKHLAGTKCINNFKIRDKVTKMQSGHINSTITQTIFRAYQIHDVCVISRAAASVVYP